MAYIEKPQLFATSFLECGWEVLSGVYHRIFAVFLLLKKVVECYSFREDCAFKGDCVGTTLSRVMSSRLHGTHGVVSLHQPVYCP